MINDGCHTVSHFSNDVLLAIQIRWEICIAVLQSPTIRWLQIFAYIYYMKLRRCCRDKNFYCEQFGWKQNDIYSCELYPSRQHTYISWWRHQMGTFFALLAFCEENSTVKSPHKGQWRGALVFSLIYAWTNGWVNNRDAGDLRRHRAHYDATVAIQGWF